MAVLHGVGGPLLAGTQEPVVRQDVRHEVSAVVQRARDLYPPPSVSSRAKQRHSKQRGELSVTTGPPRQLPSTPGDSCRCNSHGGEPTQRTYLSLGTVKRVDLGRVVQTVEHVHGCGQQQQVSHPPQHTYMAAVNSSKCHTHHNTWTAIGQDMGNTRTTNGQDNTRRTCGKHIDNTLATWTTHGRLVDKHIDNT